MGSEASRPHDQVKPPAKHYPQPILRRVETSDLPSPAHGALASTDLRVPAPWVLETTLWH